MAAYMMDMAMMLLKRDADDAEGEEGEGQAQQKEKWSSVSLLIMILLLIGALFVSYTLQTRRIQAVHETVISIFAGMFVGLILRVTAVQGVLNIVQFDYQLFFNLLLPPIILASGYELHQGNFFRNIGTILTFAFGGTFISALALGVILYLWCLLPIDRNTLSFVEAISVGATLSATDPVTILSIFSTYKVDPHLYTIIFGESILNDAVAIVIFETAQRYQKRMSADPDDEDAVPQGFTLGSLFMSFGDFMLVFFGSLVVGLLIGIGTSLLLKFTHVRRFPKIESCIVLLIAYASYFFANSVSLSGIVSLLFCGICLKHYAYHNMSRRTQLTTKFIFQVLAQLSENFIFVYLGLSLFTEAGLDFRPVFILVTTVGICIARWLAVFPLSALVNAVIRYRAGRRGETVAEELPFAHQAMLFWAGLRGAVGVALAAGLSGSSNVYFLKATVLVVVVLTVIIFGGTTARMLEILGIRTGVVEEIDSDDEFDIEIVHGPYSKRGGLGHNPKFSGNGIPLSAATRDRSRNAPYSSGNGRTSPQGTRLSRKNSRGGTNEFDPSAQNLLHSGDVGDGDDDDTDLDLPPAARRGRAGTLPSRTASAPPVHDTATASGSTSASTASDHNRQASASGGGLRQYLQRSAEDPASWFKQIDEGFIKPKLLLDPGDGNGGGGHHSPSGPGNV